MGESKDTTVTTTPVNFVGKPGVDDGAGCHAGKDALMDAARSAGKSDTLDQYAADYPVGPHDQPQSMCPAFGSLRVGLRMRRTATILSGSACCVYGLTFTSHFYGARRTVGYVPFDSETLVTGKLFEDIREAVHKMADPERYDTIIITNLCVPTASGVPLDLLPDQINGVRIVGIDVPGFGVPTHAEAKDVLAGAMLKYARTEVEQGPGASFIPHSIAPPLLLFILFTPHRFVSSKEQDDPSSDRRLSALKVPHRGLKRLVKPAVSMLL
jgi:chlorophyllide a reductase subunit Y